LNPILLHREIQDYINSKIGADVSKLALSKNPFPDVAWPEIISQIAAKTKAKDKLPTWFDTENIVYPSKTSVEQTSSEITAEYKSSMVWGESLIDLTGGFGVDDYYFSKKIKTVAHCEINPELSEIVSHNFEKLQADNTACHSGDSMETLKQLNVNWDWIYIDPSRRNDAKGKVFLLKDCLPNVPENLELYFSYSENILIKTAPLLDISAGLAELSNVKAIHIIAVKNEVKELVWELSKNYSGHIHIKTVDISKDNQNAFGFDMGENFSATFSLPKKYLFEPNSAIMKSGGFEAVSAHFKIDKLHRHSHLYTSDEKIDGFPGRIFKIDRILPYNKSGMKELAGIKKANITTRNFPDSVEIIRKKWKINEGGQVYCFFTTNANNDKIALICTKI
jgi:hypothetical protein